MKYNCLYKFNFLKSSIAKDSYLGMCIIIDLMELQCITHPLTHKIDLTKHEYHREMKGNLNKHRSPKNCTPHIHHQSASFASKSRHYYIRIIEIIVSFIY